ncbi:COX15/CtaA family protein [Brachybacterium hainanense]|uniref:Heme A synthase n=1 Tax=Brachybacterium hainanense TaxID=1541174 RepID=A0ABV6RE02_9MICO
MTAPSPADPAPASGSDTSPEGAVEVAGGVSTQAASVLTGLGAAARSRIAKVVFWGNLLCQMGIIVTGGVVRLTGSGLGCSTWPNCEPGTFTPELTMAAGIHPFIEFGNRALTGVLSVFSFALLLVAFLWLRHKGSGFLALAAVPLIGTGVQAIVGAVVVWMDLHPGMVSPHFLISPILVALSAVLVVRLYGGDGERHSLVPAALRWMVAAMAALGFLVLVLGTLVTGSGPHAGDPDSPRLPLDPRTISWLHADAVMLFCGLLVGLLIALHLIRTARPARHAAWGLVIVTLLQAGIGYLQYFTGLPEILVGAHMLGAALFAAAIAWCGAALYSWRPAAPDESAVIALDADGTPITAQDGPR